MMHDHDILILTNKITIRYCVWCSQKYCVEINCGTCQDAKENYNDGISKTNDPDEVEFHEMYLENLNDIEKDGKS